MRRQSTTTYDCLCSIAGVDTIKRALESGPVFAALVLGSRLILITTAVQPYHRTARPQLQLRLRLQQPVERERYGSYRQALGICLGKDSMRCFPKLSIEHAGRKRLRAGDDCVVGVRRLDSNPSGGQPPSTKTRTQPITHGPQQWMEHVKVVGISRQRMDQMKFSLTLWREHGTGVNTLRPSPERPSLAAEDGTERVLGNGRYLSDEIELVIFEPRPHARRELGQHGEGLRR
jgi:hypothetical protein